MTTATATVTVDAAAPATSTVPATPAVPAPSPSTDAPPIWSDDPGPLDDPLRVDARHAIGDDLWPLPLPSRAHKLTDAG